ncbi:ABC transporter permease [Paraburkholderia phenoliruptrix]|uniref:ABC transporter permease n=1 Tax=Paraburkholderia phenoliruptrix TaxID=252970 RepID=UPI002869B8C3|nr:ABC transporter permease [Paraburkholderia phenoliruptrix]WMY11782.1 ABC transporter permease [Paraburkholderia phenoliruptrix]
MLKEMKADVGDGTSRLGRFGEKLRVSDFRAYVVYGGFIVIFLAFAIALHDKGFLEPNNLLNIIRQTAIISIMAAGMTFVLAAGEIDLSVGATAGLISVVTAMTIAAYGPVAGVLLGLAAGLAVGTFNGVLSAWFGIPSFLVTLGTMGVARGTAMWISGTSAVPIVDRAYTFVFGSGQLGRIPVLVFWVAAIAVIAHVALKKTRFGRRVLATGGNPTAAKYSGIKISVVKFQALLITSSAAAVAGMLYAGRLHSGRFQLGEGDELSVIAAAVLGGTSLFGGSGTVVGSVVGALLIGVINNGLILLGLDYSQQLIARGLLIIAAVALGRSR